MGGDSSPSPLLPRGGWSGRCAGRYAARVILPDLERRIGAHLDASELAEAATLAVRGYGPQLLGYLRATVGLERADDAFALFCELMWRGLPRFRREASFATWAYQLAWGAAQRVLRDPERRRRVVLSSNALAQIAEEVRSSTAVHLRPETADRLARIRDRLDAEEQSLLVLRVDRELGWDDIATIMGVEAAALRQRFRRLKTKIRQLAEPGGSPT